MSRTINNTLWETLVLGSKSQLGLSKVSQSMKVGTTTAVPILRRSKKRKVGIERYIDRNDSTSECMKKSRLNNLLLITVAASKTMAKAKEADSIEENTENATDSVDGCPKNLSSNVVNENNRKSSHGWPSREKINCQCINKADTTHWLREKRMENNLFQKQLLVQSMSAMRRRVKLFQKQFEGK